MINNIMIISVNMILMFLITVITMIMMIIITIDTFIIIFIEYHYNYSQYYCYYPSTDRPPGHVKSTQMNLPESPGQVKHVQMNRCAAPDGPCLHLLKQTQISRPSRDCFCLLRPVPTTSLVFTSFPIAQRHRIST